MANDKKVWLANLILLLLLLAWICGANICVPCGFLCLTRIMWIYRIIMVGSLVVAAVNALLYKRHTSKAALILFIISAFVFVMMLSYYLILRYT